MFRTNARKMSVSWRCERLTICITSRRQASASYPLLNHPQVIHVQAASTKSPQAIERSCFTAECATNMEKATTPCQRINRHVSAPKHPSSLLEVVSASLPIGPRMPHFGIPPTHVFHPVRHQPPYR